MRKSIMEWAVEYVGDPSSFSSRGQLCLQFLQENGLQPGDKVLDLGCGALSQGIPLIRYLDQRCYVGVEPNGWLVEAAMEANPDLEAKLPRFSWASDFNPVGLGPFKYVIAHSVLSHAADWQLDQAFLNVRANVDPGAIWLASLRLDQYDLGARRWVYPDVSYFRFDTVHVVGFHAGWHVEHLPEYRERMTSICPSDVHNWIRCTAVESASEQNRIRLDEDARKREEQEIMEIATEEYRRRATERYSND